MSLASQSPLSAILIVALSVLPCIASADVLSDLADQCMSAVEAGDDAAFSETAEAIKKRKDVFNTEAREKAEECLGLGYGEPWMYHFPTSRFMSVAQYDASFKIAEEAKRRTAESEEQAAAKAAEQKAAKAENAERVATMVYVACTTLLARDQVAAMTNQLCVESFLANGLPNPVAP
jgi:hypothetical protein